LEGIEKEIMQPHDKAMWLRPVNPDSTTLTPIPPSHPWEHDCEEWVPSRIYGEIDAEALCDPCAKR